MIESSGGTAEAAGYTLRLEEQGLRGLMCAQEESGSSSDNSGDIPKPLRYWINSFRSASCVLVSTWQDLSDGHCIFDIVGFITQDSAPSELVLDGLPEAAG